ncbi:hypothetical protein Tco_0027048 [Tanacetum coccineum]
MEKQRNDKTSKSIAKPEKSTHGHPEAKSPKNISLGKVKKDKSEQNQSKPTRNGKGKTRVKNESQNQSRISPIQQEKKANESPRSNVDKFSKFKGSFGSF